MSHPTVGLSRRRFLRRTTQAAGLAALAQFIPGKALGLDGTVPPSEQIVVGAIGIGGRGTYVLRCFLSEPDVRVAAICDARTSRRIAAKKLVDETCHNASCEAYTDLRELLARDDIDAVLIATGPNWHCTASILAAHAGKDVYCEKPCTKNISQSLILAETFRRTGQVFQAGTQRRNVPHFQFAAELAQIGKLGKLRALYAHPDGWETSSSGWPTEASSAPKDEVDWDMLLGPAAWRPFNMEALVGSQFEKGGGFVGGGVLEWGTHTVDLCQWAKGADNAMPVEYNPPKDGRIVARYADGTELILRNNGWLPLGSCPVRFVGDAGWVETGDSGKLATSSPELLSGRTVVRCEGYPATFHVREFLDCVKSRGTPACNAEVACSSHIVCHAVNIAAFLKKTLIYDPAKHEFPGEEAANRLLSESLREPWRL